jgi:hypothetical protein
MGSAMKRNNVIELATHRGRTLPEGPAARSAQRDADHSDKAADLLEALRTTKRIKGDQPILVGNIGHLIDRLEPKNPKGLAQRILLPDHWPKRKRYIRLPNEDHNQSGRYAASGGTFAGIIDRLVDEKVRKGFDRTQATIETVYDALKGTSFRPRSRFQMLEGGGDAAFLVKAMEDVLDKLAQDADLAEYFELVSKYPIYPPTLSIHPALALQADREPNDLYKWDVLLDEEELENWIPWWAPQCVIGHVYIPFQCSGLQLTEDGVAKIKELCGGEVTPDNWRRGECSSFVAPFEGGKRIDRKHVHHRLPLWLVILPSRSGLVPCLYAPIDYHDDFQVRESLESDEAYCSYNSAITPCFVDIIGKRIEEDDLYFCGDDDQFEPLHYVRSSESGIHVIGPDVDGDVTRVVAQVFEPGWFDELPEWLQIHPIQKILRLVTDSDVANAFALAPRIFKGMGWRGDSETVFRPAFPDRVAEYTPPLLQNTIAAYLLRNFLETGDDTIFEALKKDALAKATAARELIDGELSKFQDAFDSRYGK